jgi:exopolysaccharide biosynthesis WecB/TagA/CpsF family protein
MLRLLDRMRIVADEDDRSQLIRQLMGRKRPVIVSFLNAHAFNLCWGDDHTRETFQAADYLLRDGVGLALGMVALRRQRGVNMNGTDFIPDLLEELPACRVAVYGTERPWLHKARRALEAAGHEVVGLEDGFHPDEHYFRLFKQQRPDLLVLAMGMPKQETLAQRFKQMATSPVMIINGGAVIDFLSGKVQRAPTWIRRLRMEWVFRLALEPQRLAKRYLVGNVQFLARLLPLRAYQSQIEASEGYMRAYPSVGRPGSDHGYF